MKFLRFSFQSRKILLFLCEGGLIFSSVMAGVYLRLGTFQYESVVLKAFVTVSVCLVCLYYTDLYNIRIIRDLRELLFRLIQALGASSILLAGIYYLYPQLIIGRGISLIAAVIIFFSIFTWRLLYRWFLMSRGMEENILIIGTTPLAFALAGEISTHRTLGYRVIGFIGEEAGVSVGNPVELPVLGTCNDIPEVVKKYAISRIIVSVSERRGKLPMDVLLKCKMGGVEIDEGVGFYEWITGKILVDKLRPSWLVFSSGFKKDQLTRVSKRVSEMILSFMLLLFLMPLVIFIALLIKIESRGPVFFKQERVGEHGRTFVLYKFRSMREDAEEKTGPVWAEGEDGRVTRVGKILRKIRLDEIPQLWNVLKGDMSIVGPRPERPFFVEQLSREIPFYNERHSVKPGITGWAQVRYEYGASVEDALEKLQYDLFYIKHMSLLLDLEVIIDTLKVVFLGRGAR
ncbi:MAG: TIGR03013 family PEP-CTERM/XrtA system glycosyltransferase [Deltaproteobacteria bacterium]|nr:TIGR03013 family PEP-CTERM/XrtA system glycosyltransferase [Deltaproteobacteria bacterium]